jgi:hypothetical protein
VIFGIPIAGVAAYRLGTGDTLNVLPGGFDALQWYYGHVDSSARTASSIIVGIVVVVLALTGLPGETGR